MEDNDDLLDELNELEAEMGMEELDVEIGAGQIKGHNPPQQEDIQVGAKK